MHMVVSYVTFMLELLCGSESRESHYSFKNSRW